MLKINANGATNHSSAVAAIIRDVKGGFLGCHSEVFQDCIANESEVWNFLIGIQLAKEFPSQNVIVQGDYLSIV